MAVENTNLGSFSSPLSFHLIYIPAEVTVKLPPCGTVNPPKPINVNIHDTSDADHRETVAGYPSTCNKPRVRYKTLYSNVQEARSLIVVYHTLSLHSDIPCHSLPGAALCDPSPYYREKEIRRRKKENYKLRVFLINSKSLIFIQNIIIN